MTLPSPALLAAAVTLLATGPLVLLARRAGWRDRVDAGDPRVRIRKMGRGPVPLVGGVAVALGCLAGAGASLPWVALGAALALGTIDDLRRDGLGVAAKLAGQLGVALLAAWEGGGGSAERAWRALTVLIAQNLVNTFDNADGAVAGTGAVALAGTPAAWGALVGFLPWNLGRRRAQGPPFAYLGDAGSHFVGVLCGCLPGAFVGLWLAGADLTRLSIVRWGAGSAPWVGDRRHLAHRLEAAGLAPWMVALVLAASSGAPLLTYGLLRGRLGEATAAALGLTLAAALFVALLRGTPATTR